MVEDEDSEGGEEDEVVSEVDIVEGDTRLTRRLTMGSLHKGVKKIVGLLGVK